MTIVVAVPMLGRPHRVWPLLDSIRENTPEPHRVVFATTVGDDQVNAEVDRYDCERITMPPCAVGDYARKINTIAAGYTYDLLFTAADDLRFHDGWLPAAKAKMTAGIGVVGTQDRCNRRTLIGIHATHFLIARSYVELGTIDEPGKVFYDGYPHEFVDDELVATAQHRGMWAFAGDSVVEHLHPNVGKAPLDDLYAQAPLRIRRGRHLFQQREHLWTSP